MAKKKPSGSLTKALVCAAVFAAFAMSPVLFHFTTWKFGPNISGVGSDSYGFMYGMWIRSQPADGKIRSESRDLITGYPAGRNLDFHIQTASRTAYTLAQAGFTPAAAYNFMVMVCFFFAFFIGFYIFKALDCADGPALLGAFMIGLLPNQALQAVDHIDLANTGMVLLDIYLLARLIVHREYKLTPLVILLTGLAVFTHPYYLICLVLLNAVPLLWVLSEILRRRYKPKAWEWGAAAASAASCGFTVWFWKSLFVNDGGEIENVGRDLRDLYVYSSKIWDFILPPHFSYLFARLTTAWKTEVTMQLGTNFVENTLYPGLLVLLTIAGATLFYFFRPTDSVKRVKKVPLLFFFLGIVIAVPVMCSVSPTFDFFGFEIPTPTLFIHKVFSQYRTMSRFGYVTTVGLVIAFILVLETKFLPKIRTATNRALAMAAVALFCLGDFGYFHGNFHSDTELVPPAYTYLRDQTPADAVVLEVPFMWGYLTTYWQTYHHRRNFAFFEVVNPNFPKVMATSQMDLPALVRFCKEQKIDYLVVHTQGPIQIPGAAFDNSGLDDRWMFFLFAKHSYVLKVADL